MRDSLTSMILIEEETLEDLRESVLRNIAVAMYLLSLTGTTRTATVAVLRDIAMKIQSETTVIILNARRAAAKLAYATVVIEANLVELDEELNEDDIARSQAAAMSFAAALLLALLAANILKKTSLKQVALSQEYRLARIAATEVAEAYGQAALAAYTAVPKSEYQKRWDAELDLKTCHVCRDHHGETVPLNQSFSHGDEPGAVHPRCRCQPTLVRINGNVH
jgi:SPP1 gp7 family putative phage head morphogenesis protein